MTLVVAVVGGVEQSVHAVHDRVGQLAGHDDARVRTASRFGHASGFRRRVAAASTVVEARVCAARMSGRGGQEARTAMRKADAGGDDDDGTHGGGRAGGAPAGAAEPKREAALFRLDQPRSQAKMRTGPARSYPASWLYVRPDLPIKRRRPLQGMAQGRGSGRHAGLDAGEPAVGEAHRDGARRDRRAARAARRSTGKVVWRAAPGVIGRIGQCASGLVPDRRPRPGRVRRGEPPMGCRLRRDRCLDALLVTVCSDRAQVTPHASASASVRSAAWWWSSSTMRPVDLDHAAPGIVAGSANTATTPPCPSDLRRARARTRALAGAICAGWISVLPSNPQASALAALRFDDRRGSSNVLQTPSSASQPIARERRARPATTMAAAARGRRQGWQCSSLARSLGPTTKVVSPWSPGCGGDRGEGEDRTAQVSIIAHNAPPAARRRSARACASVARVRRAWAAGSRRNPSPPAVRIGRRARHLRCRGALTRITSSRRPKPPVTRRSNGCIARASALRSGATASSRSRITTSHGSSRALAIARALLAGMNSALRRGRMVVIVLSRVTVPLALALGVS